MTTSHPPTTIGPYTVVRELGRGGMGVVYLAKDGKLDRQVAIKALPAHLAQDADRLSRFQREAKVLASLNHPGIAAIYGLEEVATGSGPAHQYLVLEYVEGESLASRLARGALPLDEALPLAKQIAEALEAAHEKGIVHRDLKPANVMLTTEGAIKVLDFGLARADTVGSASSTGVGGGGAGTGGDSPTLTSPVIHSPTIPGAIMGTAGYMSPEQARGKPVDKRSDIFSFGCVLFEMLSGKMPFAGETVADSLGATLHKEHDVALLPPAVPPRIRELLASCLAKDRKQRLHDIGDARLAIERAMSGKDGPGEVSPVAGLRARRRERAAWMSLAALALIAAALGIAYLRKPAAQAFNSGVVQLTFVPPDKVAMNQGVLDYVIVSPDGKKLVFTGASAGGRPMLWLRWLDSLDAQPLPDTEDAIEPFWSPDSRSVGFGSQGKLRRVDLGAGRAQTLCDAARLVGGSWGRAGIIVFTPDWRSGVFQIPAAGGTPLPVVRPDPARGEEACRFPCFLPDAKHFLYSAIKGGAPSGVLIGSLDSPSTTPLLSDSGRAVYAAPGWLLSMRNSVPVAQAFDAASLTLTGDPLPLSAAPVSETGNDTRLSVSENGVLVLQYSRAHDYQLAWFDRAGKPLGTLGPAFKAVNGATPELSPDGTRVVIQRNDFQARNQDIWVIDVARQTFNRLTTNAAFEQAPTWSPDGSRVAFSSSLGAGRVGGIYQMPATGGREELLHEGTAFAKQVSPDGAYLLYLHRGEATRADIWAQPLSGDRTPIPLVQSEFDDMQPQVSPDGRWLAYTSDVAGVMEVYVRPFTPAGTVGEALRISTSGGLHPRWRRDGKELFFINPSPGAADAQLMAVPVAATGAPADFGAATPLFKARFLLTPAQQEYDVAPDGERFLIGTVVGEVKPGWITITLNWAAGLAAQAAK